MNTNEQHRLDKIAPLAGNAAAGWVVHCSCGWIEFGGCQSDVADKFDDHHKAAATTVEQPPPPWKGSLPKDTQELPHTAPLAPASPSVRQKPPTVLGSNVLTNTVVLHELTLWTSQRIASCQCGWSMPFTNYLDGRNKYQLHLDNVRASLAAPAQVQHGRMAHSGPHIVMCQCGWKSNTVSDRDGESKYRLHLIESAALFARTHRTPGDDLLPLPEPPPTLEHHFTLDLPEYDGENPVLKCPCGYSTPIRIIRHRVHSDTERRVVDAEGAVSAMEVGRMLVNVLKHLELNNQPNKQPQDITNYGEAGVGEKRENQDG